MEAGPVGGDEGGACRCDPMPRGTQQEPAVAGPRGEPADLEAAAGAAGHLASDASVTTRRPRPSRKVAAPSQTAGSAVL